MNTFGFTILAGEDVSTALDIAVSFRQRFPDSQFGIVISVRHFGCFDVNQSFPDWLHLLTLGSLGLDDDELKYWPILSDTSELVSYLIPIAFQHLLQQHDVVTYLNLNFENSVSGMTLEHNKITISAIRQSLSLRSISNQIAYMTCSTSDLSVINQWIEAVRNGQRFGDNYLTRNLTEILRNGPGGFALNLSEVDSRNMLYATETGWNELLPGIPINGSLRKIFRDELRTENHLPSPFEFKELSEFLLWASSISPLSRTGLPRVIEARLFESPQILQEFFEHEFRDAVEVRRWLRSKVGELGPEAALFAHLENREVKPDTRFSISPSQFKGVDVFGYFNAVLGVGEAVRLASDALVQAGEDVTKIVIQRQRSSRMAAANENSIAKHDIALLCLDAHSLSRNLDLIGRKPLTDRYLIGQWFWELESLPNYFSEALSQVNEFWAPTRFIENAMKNSSVHNTVILHVPLPVRKIEVNPSIEKSSFGVQNKFVFYFNFDFLSVMKRKNPMAVINAYTSAFSEKDETVLVIKSINGIQRPRELEQLRNSIDSREDVFLLEDHLETSLNDALLTIADCYVSLHRSEGLGITMAEAMSIGKPVIATGYSGNLDFMNNENSILVPFNMVEVGKDGEGYPSSSVWAEPDVEFAAAAMRKVFQERDWAMNIGRKAERFMHDNYSIGVVSQIMKQRLSQIREGRNKQ